MLIRDSHMQQKEDNVMHKEVTYEYLDELLLEGLNAKRYAWDHYEELAGRKAFHKLYGPYCSGMGAGIPGSLTSKRERELKMKTRRKNFYIYELDENYKLIRVISVRDFSTIELIYHCFEVNGTQYGVPFWGSQKVYSRRGATVVKFHNKLPSYFGIVSAPLLLAHFYEYVSEEKVKVYGYSYTPKTEKSIQGVPIDWNSPIGGPASPVEKGEWEEDIRYTDFSQWFIGEHGVSSPISIPLDNFEKN